MNRFLAYSVLTASSLVLAGQQAVLADLAILSTEHVDIGVAFEDGAWDLHLHDETNDIEYAPADAILQVNASALTQVPADSRYSFLGSSGSPIFVLPQVEDPNLLFLGTGAEEIENGAFVGDSLQLKLTAFEGPGRFFSYVVNGLDGSPQRVMEAGAGGVDANLNSFTVLALGHQDYNWAFSEAGTYKLTFQASGDKVGQGITTSDGVQYTFVVVPEPSSLALGVAGLGGLLWLRSRRSPGSRPMMS
jgi:surface-anchored protein